MNDFCYDPEQAYWSDPDPWLEAFLHEQELDRINDERKDERLDDE